MTSRQLRDRLTLGVANVRGSARVRRQQALGNGQRPDPFLAGRECTTRPSVYRAQAPADRSCRWHGGHSRARPDLLRRHEVLRLTLVYPASKPTSAATPTGAYHHGRSTVARAEHSARVRRDRRRLGFPACPGSPERHPHRLTGAGAMEERTRRSHRCQRAACNGRGRGPASPPGTGAAGWLGRNAA